MTTVTVSYGELEPTHDISLSDGSTTYGLIFAGSRALQEFPLSPPADAFANEQKNWVGGRGRIKFEDDQTGYFDHQSLWSTTEGKLMPGLQVRYATNIRSCDSYLPIDNSDIGWWKLYGNTPASMIARYLSIGFVASATYSADKVYMYIRRRGTPGTLTVELCANNAGSPGTVLQTVTTTTTNVTDTVALFRDFNWTGTQALTSGTTYHLKIYGASTDTSADHWEILCNTGGTASKYSTDNSSWTTSIVYMYYRVQDADINRQWFFFTHEGGFYAVSKNDDGTTSLLKTNGVRGTATSATSTTLVDTNQAMSSNQYAGAYIRIFDGTGDGQIRQIVSNTTTAFTVAAWDITPDTTSRYVLFGTDLWTATTGTTGLASVKSKPVSIGGVCYFPQGQGSNYIRRMRVNASSHDFAADGTSTADILFVNTETVTPIIYAANSALSKIFPAPATVSWGTNLTFGSAVLIGDSTYRITNMTSFNKLLHIFKEDGLYSYANGVVDALGKTFADSPDSKHGIGVGQQGQYLFWGWSHSVERMIGSSIDDMLNFKRGYDGIPANRKGSVTSVVSAVGWLWFVLDGTATGNVYSSIICHNGMGWHETYRAPTGTSQSIRIRNAAWQPCPDSRGRLWFDVGGDMAYIEYPLQAANPLLDSSINYQPEGVIITSTYDNHDQQLYKIIANLRVFLQQGSVEVDYQTNANVGTNTWTVLGTASTSPVTDLPVNVGGVFQIRFRFRLQVTNTRTPTVITGWQVTGRMMQNKKYQYMCNFQVSTDGETKTSETDHNPDDVYNQLQTWATQQTKLTMRSLSYSADNKSVTVSLPSKSIDSLDETNWAGRISVAILEV